VAQRDFDDRSIEIEASTQRPLAPPFHDITVGIELKQLYENAPKDLKAVLESRIISKWLRSL